jgi:hypothetical protein
MSRTTRALALVVLIAAAASAFAPHEHTGNDTRTRSATPRSPATPSAHSPPATTPVTRARVAAQDRLSVRERRHEAAASQRRRLLDQLPLQLAGVRIDIAGISTDGRRTVLLVRAGRHSRRFARAAYRHALRVYRDPGRSYEPRWTR